MTDPTSWISVARLVRPQGRHGEILAEILTDFPERFAQMREAFVTPNSVPGTTSDKKGRSPIPVIIERSWLHKGRVVLKFSGVDSISAAEAMRGAQVVIPIEKRMSLDSDAAYIADLVGCQLIDVSHADHPVVGTIHDVMQQVTTADLLVVVDPAGAEHWIPFAKAYLVRLDLPGRRLEMNLPAGLLEINAPLTEEERRVQQIEPDSVDE